MIYGYIYKVTNLVNGKLYIGQTTYQEPTRRWACHLSAAKHNRTNACPALGRAILKHGKHNFTFTIIMKCRDRQHLDHAEGLCIRLFKSTANEKGYNLAEGGNGHKHSEVTKQKMSETRRKDPTHGSWNIGRKASPETRRKMSETNKRIGRQPPHTPESIEKMRLTKIGKPSPMKGKPKQDRRSRPFILNGVEYASINQASIQTGIPHIVISNWLSGKSSPRDPSITFSFLDGTIPKRENKSKYGTKGAARRYCVVIDECLFFYSNTEAAKFLNVNRKMLDKCRNQECSTYQVRFATEQECDQYFDDKAI